MDNGQIFEHFQPTRKGDPDDPLTDAELEHKLLELAGGVIGEASARLLLNQLWRIDELPSVSISLDEQKVAI